MARIPGLRRWFRPDTGAPRVLDEVDDEIRFHFEMAIAELVNRGYSADDARAEAGRRFGDVALTRERLAAIDRGHFEQRRRADRRDTLAQDVRFALRGIRRQPAVTFAIVFTLALGLGANAAVFGLLDRLFLREPVGVRAPDGLRRVYAMERTAAGNARARAIYTYPEYEELRAGVAPLASAVAYRVDRTLLRPDDAAAARSTVTQGLVGPGFLREIGARPLVGRFFTPDEERIDVPSPLAVLGYDFWRSRFGGDSAAIGRSIELDRERFRIVGIAPPGFVGLDVDAVQVWTPLNAIGFRSGPHGEPWYRTENTAGYRIVLRPRVGSSGAALIARLQPSLRHHERVAHRGDTTGKVALGPIQMARGPELGDGSGRARETVIATRLAVIALLVLLVACANVANLLLARAVERRREIAIRLALGISRSRLARQLLVESVVLALLSASAAVLVGGWVGAALRRMLLPGVVWTGSAIDLRLVGATAVLAAVGGLATGLVPALRGARADLTAALKGGGRDGSTSRSRARSGLVIAQTAVSVVLLIGAGLLLESLLRVTHVDPGYDASRIVLAEVGVDSATVQARARVEEIAARLAANPDVERVALSHLTPLRGMTFERFSVEGRDTLPALRSNYPNLFAVSPGFFATTGLRILAGRDFGGADRRGAPRVMVVNEALARLVWPGTSPLGACVQLGSVRSAPCFTVIGIVENARRAQLIEDAAAQYYVPLEQMPADLVAEQTIVPTIVLKARDGMATAVAAAARRELGRAFVDTPSPVWVMSELFEPQLRPWRVAAVLFCAVAALGLLVAAVGIYSTLAYAVSQRSHELGVRFALGARTADVTRLIVGDGLRVTLVGAFVGCVGALAAARFVERMLYDTSPRDPAVLAAVVITLVVAALGACAVPAWRASRVDPMTVLRGD